jgi:hypothetical protein
MTPTPDADLLPGYRLLLLAVIHRAVLDARCGDLEAREWLLSRETRELADWLGLPYWPPPELDKPCYTVANKAGRAGVQPPARP